MSFIFFKKTCDSLWNWVASLGPWELVPAQCGMAVNVLNWHSKKKTSLDLFANFSDINTPTMTNFKLPMWCHRMWSWEEVCTVSSESGKELALTHHQVVFDLHPEKWLTRMTYECYRSDEWQCVLKSQKALFETPWVLERSALRAGTRLWELDSILLWTRPPSTSSPILSLPNHLLPILPFSAWDTSRKSS